MEGVYPDFSPLPADCALVRVDGGGGQPGTHLVTRGAGEPVLLRTGTEARVYLGALCDGRPRVLRWLELWVQRVKDAPGIAFGPARASEADLTARWEKWTRTLLQADPARCLVTGREDLPGSAVDLPGGGVFNADGGRVFVRALPGLTLEDYVTLLTSGRLPQDTPWLEPGGEKRDLRHLPGAFLHGWSGDRPPMGEALHLKTRLIASLLDTAAAVAAENRAPLLNLTRNSWGVDWSGPEANLAAWTARPVPRLTPAVLEWNPDARSAEPVFFLNPEFAVPSVYTHPGVKPPRIVSGTVRLRDLRPLRREHGLFSCEGTLLLSEPLPALTDLLLIDCPLAAGPIQAAIVNVDPSRGEAVFQSEAWKGTPETVRAVESGGYTPPAMSCQTAIVPRLGLAADLYSLGVTALEILCCSQRQRLPLALDELCRLGRRLEAENTPVDSLGQALAAWSRRESTEAWVETLHPRHLVSPPVQPETAWRAAAPEAWFSLLAVCLRLLTGQTRYAFFAGPDEGGVSADTTFAAPRAALAALAARTRGLAVMDWEKNREIRDEILTLLK